MATANIRLDPYVQDLFCKTAHGRTVNWFLHILGEKNAFTELSEVNWPDSPQDNDFADIYITAVLEGFRRDESQTSLMGNPLNRSMILFLTISIYLGVCNITSTNAVCAYQIHFSAVFTKWKIIDLGKGLFFLQRISDSLRRRLIYVLLCMMCNCCMVRRCLQSSFPKLGEGEEGTLECSHWGLEGIITCIK